MLSIQYLYAIYLGLVDTVVLGLLKAKSIGALSGNWIFPLAFLVYGTQSFIFYKSLSFESMGIMNILWDVISDILVAVIGVVLFGESLNSIQCMGILLSIIGITMLGYK